MDVQNNFFLLFQLEKFYVLVLKSIVHPLELFFPFTLKYKLKQDSLIKQCHDPGEHF